MSTLTLPAADIDRIGAEAAWAAVRDQAIHQVGVAAGVMPSVRTFRWEAGERAAVPGILVHLADDDPSMVHRIAWEPQHLPYAQMLLDRAWLLSLPGPRVSPTEIDFWTEGRILTLTELSGDDWDVPVEAFGWLSTGDVDGKVVHRPGVKVTTDRWGTQERYQDGRPHRDDGPAVIYWDGALRYYQHGRLHRDDGPAIIYPNGVLEYFQHGQRHRDDGLARIWRDGTQEWYQHGGLHRDDGPAVIHPDGTEEYWVNGEQVEAFVGHFTS